LNSFKKLLILQFLAYISEQHIVNLLKNGDSDAISIIYENYASALFGIILKITINESLAEDALQESIIKIWKYAHKYDSKKAKLFTWMYRIARNTAIDKLRSYNLKHNKEVQITNSNVFKLSTNNFNEDTIDLKKHLSNLDLKYQTVINALYFGGMTQQEASDELNIPLGTIKSRLKIGLRELKKVYNP
jgi:RNA polymerase sigma factor (sigma-70 family)